MVLLWISMKRSRAYWLVPLLYALCFTAQAACVDDAERVRGEYLLSLAPASGVLLRIEQVEEELTVLITEQQASMRIAHPGGAGLAHYILLESGEAARDMELCLLARYAHAQAGSYDILAISTTNFSAAGLSLLRAMTQASVYWG